ncbi:hypothetical protein [Bacillus sp. FJAT-18017]|uniref:hypothetical protein n=1 Tax=Bacillus sp. FJAT-18017 TaxID=1705566 RepID=UPI0012E26A9F|nr:hypothetical protein [Bacillus sp. FJAT-18017]
MIIDQNTLRGGAMATGMKGNSRIRSGAEEIYQNREKGEEVECSFSSWLYRHRNATML